jgi:hypothetical protein
MLVKKQKIITVSQKNTYKNRTNRMGKILEKERIVRDCNGWIKKKIER